MTNALEHTGLWLTRGGVRLELRPDGRYGKITADKQTYAGRYEINGARVLFVKDDGKQVRGRVMNGVLTIGPHLYMRAWPEAGAPVAAARAPRGIAAMARDLMAWAAPSRARMME